MKHRLAADLWLTEVGLLESHDPNVQVLRSVAEELDDIEADVYDSLTDKQKLDVSRNARNTLASARKAIQGLVDKADSAAARKRHQLIYAEVAAEGLGLIDADLLPEALRAKVAKHLADEHGINLASYTPIRREG